MHQGPTDSLKAQRKFVPRNFCYKMFFVMCYTKPWVKVMLDRPQGLKCKTHTYTGTHMPIIQGPLSLSYKNKMREAQNLL